jgi:hypothetical protein
MARIKHSDSNYHDIDSIDVIKQGNLILDK